MAHNVHASAAVVGDRCILISGESGMGKSALAIALVMHARALGHFGRMVGDDQLLLSVHAGRLICAAPAAIAGLVEIRGLGPVPIAHERRAQVDLFVELVGGGEACRFPETRTRVVLGCAVPLLVMAGGDTASALRAVAAHLALPPFR